MDSKSFILHKDSLGILDCLTDEQAGQLFKAIRNYQDDDKVTINDVIKLAFFPFKAQFDRDNEKYIKICNRNKNNGLKGGRPKTQKTQSVKLKPRKADSKNKNKNDSDSDKTKERDYPKELNISAWNEYIAYRKETKIRKLTKSGEVKQIEKIIRFGGHEIQQQCINETISNGWQGIFEPKNKLNGGKSKAGNFLDRCIDGWDDS